MERLIGISSTGVKLILEYNEGATMPRDAEGNVRTQYIPTAIRLEAVEQKTRPVLRYKEIERDPSADISKSVAYIVRGGLTNAGREFAVSLDLRTATTARAEVPPPRRAFFTDAQLFLRSDRIPDSRDLARKSMPETVPNGERLSPIRGSR